MASWKDGIDNRWHSDQSTLRRPPTWPHLVFSSASFSFRNGSCQLAIPLLQPIMIRRWSWTRASSLALCASGKCAPPQHLRSRCSLSCCHRIGQSTANLHSQNIPVVMTTCQCACYPNTRALRMFNFFFRATNYAFYLIYSSFKV